MITKTHNKTLFVSYFIAKEYNQTVFRMSDEAMHGYTGGKMSISDMFWIKIKQVRNG